jgi:GNAT superfamily N-acetyltransferase
VGFVSEPIGPQHDCSAFDSGKPALDVWLREHALHARQMRSAATFVWHRGDHVVIAYYSLAAHLIERAEIPPRIGRGSPRQIPSILIARLALEESRQGHGHGGALLADCLSRAVDASERVAARLAVVDAIDDDARRFYEHFGFRAIPETNRLLQKMSDIAAALGR